MCLSYILKQHNIKFVGKSQVATWQDFTPRTIVSISLIAVNVSSAAGQIKLEWWSIIIMAGQLEVIPHKWMAYILRHCLLVYLIRGLKHLVGRQIAYSQIVVKSSQVSTDQITLKVIKILLLMYILIKPLIVAIVKLTDNLSKTIDILFQGQLPVFKRQIGCLKNSLNGQEK